MAFKISLNSLFRAKRGQIFNKGENALQITRKQADKNTIVIQIIKEFKNRNRADIDEWRRALAMATHPENPRLYVLQDLFDNLQSDLHYISEKNLRKDATLCADFSVINRQSGDIEGELTEFFRGEWFFNFRSDALEHITRGCTLLELTDPVTLEFKVIPRRNVSPMLKRVYLKVGDDRYIDYSNPAFKYSIIKVGKDDDLGLLADMCGQLIWKRNAQQSWAEFSERYGQPLITAITNKTAKQDLDKIEAMLDTLGEAARAVMPEGTTIDIKPFSGADSYQVYDKQIDRINSEISKPLVGGTMLTDDGSSRSQSEVHERNLDEKIAARDKLIVEFITNGQLIPMLQAWGYPIDPQIHKFRYDASFELTLKEFWEVVRELNQYYDIPITWISKTFNVPLDAVKQRLTSPTPTPAEEKKDKSKAVGFTSNFK
ncbi:hypothetical protein FACS1894169_00960 [Bacteroidia bacterium]|nr:hypothetical protein FACS1894169_00960 [Bacteroidia bacterium]